MQPYYERNDATGPYSMTSLTSTQQQSDRWNSPACQIPHVHRIIPQDRIEPNTPKIRHIPRLYLSTIVKATGAQHKIYNIDISPLCISHPWLVERSTYQDHQRYQIPDAATVTWTWYSAEEREMWGGVDAFRNVASVGFGQRMLVLYLVTAWLIEWSQTYYVCCFSSIYR